MRTIRGRIAPRALAQQEFTSDATPAARLFCPIFFGAKLSGHLPFGVSDHFFVTQRPVGRKLRVLLKS